MNLSITRKTHGGGDNSWLGSRHGVANARTVTLDADAFTGLTDGIVPSGTPINVAGDLAVPFTDVAGAELAFVIGTQSVADGDATVPALDHGRVIVANVPGTFTVPATAATGAFVFA
jgi:hypothetical protein